MENTETGGIRTFDEYCADVASRCGLPEGKTVADALLVFDVLNGGLDTSVPDRVARTAILRELGLDLNIAFQQLPK